MNENEKIPVLAVVGPTASGKTALGAALAKEYGGEVVSADSMQIYKGMSIATAKPTFEEMQGIPHHLIDFLDMGAAFSVADYVSLAGEVIRDIRSRERLPVVVGGTGLYVSSLLDNIQFSEFQSNSDLRDELAAFAEKNGKEALHGRLAELDPEAASEIHPNNLVRVIRALEVCIETGEKFSVQKEKGRSAETPYRSCIIGLDYEDRTILYDRINRRVDMMMEAGLEEEAFRVWQGGKMKTAANAIGYKELVPYFEGKASLEECVEEIKLQTRHYAKRQLTWFRRNKQIEWLFLDKIDNLKKIQEKCQKVIAKSKLL
ncbi:MAG: tRNA (adenosine(37)-N6)-dimethylallyltransferase MiaA [Oscillospiraceae bacterium]|nr:tRNA (adenosine(37)-N6)-dimethylallyltransferase MiaA [Oscillospiraceae bacterium]